MIALPKQKRAMRSRMWKPHELKVIRYADHLIDLNDYLAAFPGVKEVDNIGETDLNEIFLNSINRTHFVI